MTIVVTTPTGNVGSRVVRVLLQAGERPRLFLRDPSRLDPAVLDRVDVHQGDQADAGAVLAATRGARALLWVDPPTDADDPVESSARLGAHAARAVAEHGIPRVVFQSSVGAELRGGAGQIDGLARVEELLDATGASVTHLRCGYFFTNLLGDLDGLRAGVLTTAQDLDLPMPWVDPRDVGDVAAARLLSASWSGRHVLAVHGPEHLTFTQVAAVLTEATGRPVRAGRIADDDLRAVLRGVGMTGAQVEGIVRMSSGLREGFVPEDARDVVTTTPTRLGGWAYERLRPLLAEDAAGQVSAAGGP